MTILQAPQSEVLQTANPPGPPPNGFYPPQSLVSVSPGVIRDANQPLHQMAVNADGSIDISGSDGATVASVTNPVATTTPIPASIVTGQAVIASGGTAVQLSGSSSPLKNGMVIQAYSGNSGYVTIGGSGVSNTVNGTGNGYILGPGQAVWFACSNANIPYFNGTTGAIVSFLGN